MQCEYNCRNLQQFTRPWRFPVGGRPQEVAAHPADGDSQGGASPAAPPPISDGEEEDIFEGAGRAYEDPAAARARNGGGAQGAGAERGALFGTAERLADLPGTFLSNKFTIHAHLEVSHQILSRFQTKLTYYSRKTMNVEKNEA